MNKIFLFGLSLVAVGAFYNPNLATASELPAPSMIRLSDSHVLFSTTFNVGYMNRSATLPLAVSQGKVLNALNYEFVNTAGKTVPTNSQAIILAKGVTLKNNAYLLPYGQSESFTLYAIAQIPKEAEARALQITAIPHTMTDQDNVTLNVAKLPSTLTSLTTPFSR
jgi:hypothetical protein